LEAQGELVMHDGFQSTPHYSQEAQGELVMHDGFQSTPHYSHRFTSLSTLLWTI